VIYYQDNNLNLEASLDADIDTTSNSITNNEVTKFKKFVLVIYLALFLKTNNPKAQVHIDQIDDEHIEGKDYDINWQLDIFDGLHVAHVRKEWENILIYLF
jgi:hypothetical protein